MIPGVSGGTIAFITGIYERLIDCLRSFDFQAMSHLRKFQIGKFLQHIDFKFLAALMLGVLVSIFSLAKLLEYLFAHYPVLIWAFFFGLIMASVFAVGKMVRRWGPVPIVCLLVGAAVAITIALLTPGRENTHFVYLILCGIVAVSSMLIPGLSGSFVLLLMGNYILILSAIANWRDTMFTILLPVGIGCVIGLVVFSHALHWVFKHFHDVAVSLITGFILGSLLTIWPWKKEVFFLDPSGGFKLDPRSGEKIVSGYEWLPPDFGVSETWWAIGLIVLGILAVLGIEFLGSKRPSEGEGEGA